MSAPYTVALDDREGLPAWSHQTLLKSLLESGAPVTYGCGAGNCGACRYRLKSGQVDEVDTGVLSEKQKARGEILTCQAKPLSDVVLESPLKTAMDAIDLNGVITRVERPTSDLVKLRVKLESPIDYFPGQYALLKTPHGPGRPYSFASLSGTPVVEFHIRAVPGGAAGPAIYNKANRGDPVRVTAPLGRAYAEDLNRPVLMVATGTGLAPMKAVMQTLQNMNHNFPVRLIWGNRTEADLYEMRALEGLFANHSDAEMITVFSQEGERKRVTDVLSQVVPSLMGWVVFCAGNPAMVADVERQMPLMGASASDFHADPFTPFDND